MYASGSTHRRFLIDANEHRIRYHCASTAGNKLLLFLLLPAVSESSFPFTYIPEKKGSNGVVEVGHWLDSDSLVPRAGML